MENSDVASTVLYCIGLYKYYIIIKYLYQKGSNHNYKPKMWRIHEINGLAKIVPIVLNSSNLVCWPFRLKLNWFYCKCDLYRSFANNRSLNPRKFIPTIFKEAGWLTNYPLDLSIIIFKDILSYGSPNVTICWTDCDHCLWFLTAFYTVQITGQVFATA